MTAQQQARKQMIWSKITTVALGLCTSVLVWVGSYQVKMYNAWILQPKINEQQTAAILNIISDIKDIRVETSAIKNEQTRMGGKIIYLEAIMPDKNQFKIR